MIDAVTFAHSYNAFWQETAPTSEHYIRRLNLEYYERLHPPNALEAEPERRGLISETAFGLLEIGIKSKIYIASALIKPEYLERALLRAIRIVGNFDSENISMKTSLDRREIRDVYKLLQSMLNYFHPNFDGMIARPFFSGCGFIDESEGDLLQDKTLYEIKNVSRPFRSTDLRQLITYCSLNHIDSKYSIEKIGILNAAQGTVFSENLEEVCIQISGSSADELMYRIIEAVSSNGISR